MVGRRDTDEARQAAREARRRREKRKRYERLLEEHPAVKSTRARMAPIAERRPLKRGVPKLIAEATQDRDVAMAVTAMRRVMKYHRRAGDLVRRHLRRERVPLNEQKALLRQGRNVEQDLQEALRSASKAIRANLTIEAYAAAIAARPDYTEIFDNLPSYLSRSELAAIRYIGIEPQELSEAWDQIYTPRRQEIWELMTSHKIYQKIESIEKSTDQIEFREAPQYLVEKGIITISSDGPVADVVENAPPFIAIAAMVVAVVLVPWVAPFVVPLIVVAGAILAVATGVVYDHLYIGDKDDFDEWYNRERSELYDDGNLREDSWLCRLPDCPSSLEKGPDDKPTHQDPRFNKPETAPATHKGAEWEIRSNRLTGVDTAQQCCYTYDLESKDFKLVTQPPAAGTPDKARLPDAAWADFPWLHRGAGHLIEDLKPWDMARKLDESIGFHHLDGPNVAKYFEVRPPNKGGPKLAVEIEGRGRVTSCVTSDWGKQVTISVNPAYGWRFVGWEGYTSGDSPTITINMDSDQSLKAFFEKIPIYTLKIARGTGQGTTNPESGTYEKFEGSRVPISASAVTNYEFDYWRVNGKAVSTEYKIDIYMDEYKEVYANFKRRPAPSKSTLQPPRAPIEEPYIANRSSAEIHRSDCLWVTKMKDSNKRPCSSLGEVAELIRDRGYNGCFYCLPRYDRDTLTAQHVLTNLEEDLGH